MAATIHDGLKHHQAGRLQQAERIYRDILARDPHDADALHLLGVIAFQMRQFEPAAQLIRRAIAINPKFPMYYNNLGNVLRSLGRRDESGEAYERAVQLDPNFAEAWVNVGTALRDRARFHDAIAAYDHALRINPSLAAAYSHHGTVLKDQGRIEEAITSYRRALEIKPDFLDAQYNLLYALHFSDQFTPAQIFDEHVRWGRMYPTAASSFPHERSPHRRLRIGYVTADFRDHPVARFLQPVIAHRDTSRFEIVCYSVVDRPDEITSQWRTLVDEWHDVTALTPEQLAEFIRSDRIDILVDLAGHTGGTRIVAFAKKPAPVQFSWIGYPDTTGLAAVDYRIVDANTDPPGEADARSVETLARVDGCFLCYELCDDLPVTPLPGAANGYITFGSFNNLGKISPTTIRLWTDVLAAVPGARMIIKTTTFGDEPTRAQAAERFRQLGLPLDRVELLGPLRSQLSHLETYRRIDIALDTFPYCGTTTTCEALSMGVPVVSLFGQHHASRVGLSLLSAAGFGQWATNDPARFAEIAKELATNRSQLEQLRQDMRTVLRQSVLCDTRSYARKIERIYRDAWTRWCDQYNPRP